MTRLESLIMVRLPEEMLEALKIAAAEDERTPSNLVRKVLSDYLRKQGYLKAKPKSAGRKRGGKDAKA